MKREVGCLDPSRAAAPWRWGSIAIGIACVAELAAAAASSARAGWEGDEGGHIQRKGSDSCPVKDRSPSKGLFFPALYFIFTTPVIKSRAIHTNNEVLH